MQWIACGLFALCVLWGAVAWADDAGPTSRPAGDGHPAVTDVWVVFKTHFDLGYTDTAANVFRRYRVTMMEGALKTIEQSRTLPASERFAWTISGWPLKQQILGPEQEPDRRARIEQAIREGSLVFHALPFSMHTESLEPEELVRGLQYSVQLAREFDRPMPISAKMTDVPEHSWIMPTLLSHAGVKFLHLGCNGGSAYPRVPGLFWWEGPDGSRVLCDYTIEYGSGLVPPKDWPCANYLAMIMTGDNHGPPTPAEIEKIRKQAASDLPGVRLHLGTLDDFARAVLKENPTLPVIRADMPDTWIHGLMSMPQESGIARQIRPLEPALEALDTQMHAWGINTTDVAHPLADAYEFSLLYGEHTWGMNSTAGPLTLFGDAWKKWLADEADEVNHPDAKPAPGRSKRKWLESYDTHRNYIHRTQSIVQPLLRERLDALAAAVKVEGSRVIAWNALSWARGGMVDLPPGMNATAVRDIESGELLAVQQSRFWVDQIPGQGYRTFVPVDSPVTATPADEQASFETPNYTVRFDLKRGGIESLVEKTSGRELVDTRDGYVLGQFLHERFSTNEVLHRFVEKYARGANGWAGNDFGKPGMPGPDVVPYRAMSPGPWKLSHVRGPIADVVTLTCADPQGLAQAYAITYTFANRSPWIDVEWSVTGKTPEKLPEGGWLCFPLNIDQPAFLLGRPGGPVDPGKQIVAGANRRILALSNGLTVASPSGQGIGVCPVHSPLVSLQEPGLWRWDLDFVPKRSSVFVNLYNNMWNTNFPLWQEGSWKSRVRLWPTTELVAPAWEARLPLLAGQADGKPGSLPVVQEGLTLSRKGVLVTAFGQNLYGPGTTLRLWDQSGQSGELMVTLPKGFRARQARPVNLRGESEGEPIGIQSGQFKFTLSGYSPATFLLDE